MPINRSAIVDVLQQISVQGNLKCTVTESLKGAATVGGFAFGGGLLGGPIGMGIGGVIGSVIATIRGQGRFKPVSTVLAEELTEEQKYRLETRFVDIFRDIDATDVTAVVAIVMSSNSLQALVIKQLAIFLKNEMGMALT